MALPGENPLAIPTTTRFPKLLLDPLYAESSELHDEIEHAARQLPDGRWTSKLGPDEDIEHSLDSLEGDFFGKVVQFMKKPLM